MIKVNELYGQKAPDRRSNKFAMSEKEALLDLKKYKHEKGEKNGKT